MISIRAPPLNDLDIEATFLAFLAFLGSFSFVPDKAFPILLGLVKPDPTETVNPINPRLLNKKDRIKKNANKEEGRFVSVFSPAR